MTKLFIPHLGQKLCLCSPVRINVKNSSKNIKFLKKFASNLAEVLEKDKTYEIVIPVYFPKGLLLTVEDFYLKRFEMNYHFITFSHSVSNREVSGIEFPTGEITLPLEDSFVLDVDIVK